jgi:tetratricopeptide (TPR) repeat protein
VAVDSGQMALREARSAGALPRRRLAMSEITLAHRLRDIGHYREAMTLLEQASQAMSDEHLNAEQAWIEHRLAVIYQHLGQPERARGVLRTEREGLHAGLALMRLVHRADVTRQLGGDGLPMLRQALAIVPDTNDIYHRIATLFATWLVPPDEGEALGASLAVWATSRERLGVALCGHVRAAACGLHLGAPARAVTHVEAALKLAGEFQPETFYLPEMWLVAAKAYEALGQGVAAARSAAAGHGWVMAVHDEHVPEPYRSSFLHRNLVNRDLLALSARLAAAQRGARLTPT